MNRNGLRFDRRGLPNNEQRSGVCAPRFDTQQVRCVTLTSCSRTFALTRCGDEFGVGECDGDFGTKRCCDPIECREARRDPSALEPGNSGLGCPDEFGELALAQALLFAKGT